MPILEIACAATGPPIGFANVSTAARQASKWRSSQQSPLYAGFSPSNAKSLGGHWPLADAMLGLGDQCGQRVRV